jgi:hypothetical protein
MLFQRGAMQVFGDGLVRRWLAGQDEAADHPMDGLGDRLAGEEIVAQVDRPKVRHRRTEPGQPAFGGVPLTVLLLRSVLGRDELGWQRQDAGIAGRHDGGAQKGVEVSAVRTPPGRAAFAMDLARAKVLRPVQRDQRPATEALKRREYAFGLDDFEEQREQRIECRRRCAVEHQADVGIARDGGHAEQGLAVRPALPFLQRPLVRQERRATHEEHRERGQTDVGHAVCPVAARALPLIRQTGADVFQSATKEAKAFTTASSQRHGRAARQNRHSRWDETTKSETCCKSDSVRPASGGKEQPDVSPSH